MESTSPLKPMVTLGLVAPAAARSRRQVLLLVAAVIAVGCGTFVTTSYVALSSSRALSNRHTLQDEQLSRTIQSTPRPRPVTSVLHPRTVFLPTFTADHFAKVEPESRVLEDGANIVESTEYFPQRGQPQRGLHWRLQNHGVLGNASNKDQDSLLLVVVLKDHESWGLERSSTDLFEMLEMFTFPRSKISLTMLVSDMAEFQTIQQQMHIHIGDYAQFSLLFRSDLDGAANLTRDGRHASSVQNERRRMLARYRNFALLSTLQSWHQHVVWLDADVEHVPPHLVTKMTTFGLDIVEPICYRGTREYDYNAWVGTRTKPDSSDDREKGGFVPAGLHNRHMNTYRNAKPDFVPLDSVGGTMLYVNADIHRQGVLFTHHYVIGSEWDQEGYDGIETEGLCYSAHFLGYRCWGMPHDADAIHHVMK